MTEAQKAIVAQRAAKLAAKRAYAARAAKTARAQMKAASEKKARAAALAEIEKSTLTRWRKGADSEPSGWPLPSEWDKFIPPQAVNISVERIREEIGGGTLTRPVWNQEWLRGLEAFIRSIAQDEIRKANTQP